jgi:hypothetical protein
VPLKYQVADLNEIPEALRAEYAEHTDDAGQKSFRLALDLPDNFAVEDVKGLKSALQRERENAREAERLRKAAEERAAGAGSEALQAEVATLRETLTASERRLQDAIAANEMGAAVAKHRGNPHVLLPVLKTMTKVVDGAVVVLDAAGQPRAGVTVDALVAELAGRDEYAGSFAGTGQSGGASHGTQGSKGSGSSGTLTLAGRRRSSMSPKERVAAIKELGNDAYMRLPW